MSGGITASMAAQIGAGLGGIQFSHNTPLVVPGIQTDATGPSLTFAPLVDIPSEQHTFVKMFSEVGSVFTVPTKWGDAEVNPKMAFVKHDEHIAQVKITRPNFKMNYWVFSCGLDEHVRGDLKEWERGAEVTSLLVYDSYDSKFAITQVSFMLLTYENSRFLAKRENGVSTIHIMSGVELIKTALQLKAARGGAGFSKNKSWEDIARSLRPDSDNIAGSGQLTPCTAYYLAKLFSQELNFPMMATLNDTTAYYKDSNIWKSSSDDAFSFLSAVEGKGFFTDVYSRVPEIETPKFGIFYSPDTETRDNTGISEFNERPDIDSPIIDIFQNTLFNSSGAEPFAEVVADLLFAAKHMHPDFPLRVPQG